MRQPIFLFSALEDVLINSHTFKWDSAREILNQAYLEQIPWMVWSHWTVQEVIYFRGQLGLVDPFIAENGGALYIPFGYFDFEVNTVQREGHEIIENGLKAEFLREFLEDFRRENKLPLKFADEFSVQEFAEMARIPYHVAGFRQNSLYSIAFYVEPYASGNWEKELFQQAQNRGIIIRKDGLIYTAVGNNDERALVAKLRKLIRRNLDVSPKIIGIGARSSDKPYLENADWVFWFKKRGMSVKNPTSGKGRFMTIDSADPNKWNIILQLMKNDREEERDAS